MNLKDDFEIITPDEKLLMDSVRPEDKVCPIRGCGKTMRNSSSLRLHIVKTHGEGKIQKSSSGKRRLFACPIKGCPRNVESPRQNFFPILYNLKMHYLSVHGEKRFECSKCSKRFGNYLVFDQHVNKCKQLFYCECGVYYTTKNALHTHAKRKGHKMIGLKDDDVASKSNIEKNALPPKVTVQGLLYIPSLLGDNMSLFCSNEKFTNAAPPLSNISTFQSKLIRILPKTTQNLTLEKQANSQDSIGKVVGIHISDKSENVVCSKNILNFGKASCGNLEIAKTWNTELLKNCNSGIIPSTVSMDVPPLARGKRKLSKFERDRILLASAEAQAVLSDPLLLSETIAHQQKLKELKAKAKKLGQKYKCKESSNNKRVESTVCSASPSLSKCADVFNELNTSPKRLADTFTQTLLTFKDIEEFVPPKKSSIDTQTFIDSFNFSEYTTVEVLETSDFSMQCQMPAYHIDPNVSGNLYPPTDNETQTEVSSSWLDNFPCSDLSNMETQTNISEFVNYPQADLSDNEEPLLLDKSIQLDHMIGLADSRDVILTESSNISTQTSLIDPWFNESFIYESSSTQTDMLEKIDLMNIDFHIGRETSPEDRKCKDLLISDSISEESNQSERNNIETQTSISLYDLLDSSFIEDYLNMEKNMMNIETQTCEDYPVNCKHTANIETQTDYFM